MTLITEPNTREFSRSGLETSSSKRNPAAVSKADEYQLTVVEKNRLLEKYLPMVDRIAAKIARNLPNHIDTADLRSIGIIGLMHAVEKYNPEQEQTFQAYVALRVRGSILDELRRMDCMPRTSRAKARRLQSAQQELEQELGRSPSDEELRKHLDLKPAEFEKMRRRTQGYSFVSLDAGPQKDDGSDTDLHDTIPDNTQELSYENLQKQELKDLLLERISTLPTRQKKVIAMYYHEGLRLSDIAQAFGVTEARICQIHSQAVGTLRKLIFASYQS